MRKIIIAIDGFSGTGKSSTAREVAKRLSYNYVDSGAMYRAATLFFINNSIDINDLEAVRDALRSLNLTFEDSQICINGQKMSVEIRSMQVNNIVSQVAAIKAVRQDMVRQQKQLSHMKGLVMDGRDIGTVVFPDAELKVFMTANSNVRARRRKAELELKGIFDSLESIKENLIARDKADSIRKESPLIQADDAVLIDSSSLSFEEQVDKIVSIAKTLIYAN